MNATEVQAGYRPVEEATVKTVEGGAIMESIGAVATIALAIVGLAGVLSTTMAAIATIILGAAIWVEGGAFAVTHSQTATPQGSVARILDWSEGLAAEFLGGLAGIVLGVLALLGVAPFVLLSVAVLVFGATFLLSGVTTTGSNSQSLMGLGALILGILAVVGLNTLTLVLTALLCLGASALLHGAATNARLAFAAHRRSDLTVQSTH